MTAANVAKSKPAFGFDLSAELRGLDAHPVIVLGMHRSGTTMLAKLLSKCGVFMGEPVSKNHEAVFFQYLNRDILDRFGCGWAHLQGFPTQEELQRGFEKLLRATGNELARDMAARFFGGTDLVPKLRQWGWKDPRNCVTAPFLQRLFPGARAIFIRRDPRNVALSLLTREMKYGISYDRDVLRARFLHFIDVWEETNRRALAALPLFEKTTSAIYEEVAVSPLEEMMRILSGVGVQPPAGAEELILAEVRSDRIDVFGGPEGEPFRDLTISNRLFQEWYGK